MSSDIATKDTSYTGPMVTLIVGKDRQELQVHTHIFQNSGSSTLAALVDANKPWREAQEGRIDWSDQHVDIVLEMLHYLYFKHSERFGQYQDTPSKPGSSKKEIEGKFSTALHNVKVYIFADFYLLNKLQESAIASLRKILEVRDPELMLSADQLVQLVVYVYDNTLVSSKETPLQAAISDCISGYIMDLSYKQGILDHVLEKYPPLAFNICLKVPKICVSWRIQFDSCEFERQCGVCRCKFTVKAKTFFQATYKQTSNPVHFHCETCNRR